MDLKYWAVAIVVTMIATVLLINLINQPIYDLGACTINSFDCGDLEWDGTCTDAIGDECCMPVRMCGGTSTTQLGCNTKYCETDGKMCVGEYNLATELYDCKCVAAVS